MVGVNDSILSTDSHGLRVGGWVCIHSMISLLLQCTVLIHHVWHLSLFNFTLRLTCLTSRSINEPTTRQKTHCRTGPRDHRRSQGSSGHNGHHSYDRHTPCTDLHSHVNWPTLDIRRVHTDIKMLFFQDFPEPVPFTNMSCMRSKSAYTKSVISVSALQ